MRAAAGGGIAVGEVGPRAFVDTVGGGARSGRTKRVEGRRGRPTGPRGSAWGRWAGSRTCKVWAGVLAWDMAKGGGGAEVRPVRRYRQPRGSGYGDRGMRRSEEIGAPQPWSASEPDHMRE